MHGVMAFVMVLVLVTRLLHTHRERESKRCTSTEQSCSRMAAVLLGVPLLSCGLVCVVFQLRRVYVVQDCVCVRVETQQ